MSVFQTVDLQGLPKFSKQQDQLVVVERKPLEGETDFFHKLMQKPFMVIGKVFKDTSAENIQKILENNISDDLMADPFYMRWVLDMAKVCKIFCDTLDSEAVGFCLGTERGCSRYHIDNVPMRLLVTYAGKGTEWLPDEASDRGALANGLTDEKIIKNPSDSQFMRPWDIAVFRGGPKGLLHRTPDAAQNGPSIMMRLDNESFWDYILKKQQGNLMPHPVNTYII
tara:strand:+ start:318 stop:992 length:675 start_codon:yes stop_codon:yes gene_type:complete